MAAAGTLTTAEAFTPTSLATADLDDNVNVRSDGIKFQTRKSTDVMIQKIVIDPGGTSGWRSSPWHGAARRRNGFGDTGGSTVYATFVAPSADPHVFRIEDNPPRVLDSHRGKRCS